jgi:serine/threonine protein kinase
VLSARILGVALAALLFGGAHYAGTLLDRASSERVAAEAARVAEAGALKVRDALTEETRSVSRMASDAMAIPPLVSALNGHMEGRDLGDLLASTPWWTPFRGLAAAVSYRNNMVSFAEPGLRGVPFGQVIAQVRARGEAAQATLGGQTNAHIVAALTVPGTVSYPPVIFVLGKALDDPMLARLAETAGGSVMVVESQRSLGHAGPDAELLERTLRPDRTDKGEPGWAMSWFAIGPELSMWVGTRPREIARAQAASDKRKKAGLWAGALLLAAPIVVSAFRKKAPEKNKRGRNRTRTRTVGVAAAAAPMAPAPVARPRPQEPSPVIEALLAHYQLIDRIAEGSMAEVFTAYSQGGGGPRRSLVVKRLKEDRIEDPAAVAHFTEEASLLSRLSHANLVPVFDNGEVDGTYFIAEEYVVGRDLGRITKRLMETGRPPLSPAGVLYVVHEILGGLAYLHATCPGQDAPDGFVHRDLAPRKVMVSRLGKVKLLDFRIVRTHQQAQHTEIGTSKGLVDFMSPEQARGRPLDRRSDLFSVGLLLYHCATGEPLYRGDTQYDRVSRAAHGPGPQEHTRIAALPAPLANLLKRALDIHPDRRFQTAEEFRAAVERLMEGGEDEVAGVISDLFDDELQQEIDRLSAGVPTLAAGRA